MYLVDVMKEYDTIFNLGFNCQGIYHSKRHGLCSGNGPTDWLATHSLPILIDLIDRKFKDFMLFDNLKIIGENNKFHVVFDDVSNCASYHEFPSNYTIEEYYNEFKTTLNRRIERFYSKLASSESVLFIRTSYFESEVNYLQKLSQVLEGYVKGSFNIAFIELNPNVDKIIDKQININNVCYIQMPRGENWIGNEGLWDYFLSNIKLLNN